MNDIPVIMEDGKPVFIGREDPNNTICRPADPNSRFCSQCKKSAENTFASCPHCGSEYNDSKMECPVCHAYFDYLVGSNDYGGVMGCEAHWKPPTRKGGVHESTSTGTREEQDVFSL